MFPGLYQPEQIIAYHFSLLLMDGKNLITKTQAKRVLFVLKCSIVLKACLMNIVDVCFCLIFLTQRLIDKIKLFTSIFDILSIFYILFYILSIFLLTEVSDLLRVFFGRPFHTLNRRWRHHG